MVNAPRRSPGSSVSVYYCQCNPKRIRPGNELSRTLLTIRYRLHFERESQEEIEQRKMKAKKLPLTPVSEVRMDLVRLFHKDSTSASASLNIFAFSSPPHSHNHHTCTCAGCNGSMCGGHLSSWISAGHPKTPSLGLPHDQGGGGGAGGGHV